MTGTAASAGYAAVSETKHIAGMAANAKYAAQKDIFGKGVNVKNAVRQEMTVTTGKSSAPARMLKHSMMDTS